MSSNKKANSADEKEPGDAEDKTPEPKQSGKEAKPKAQKKSSKTSLKKDKATNEARIKEIIKNMEPRPLVILYAGETGNCEDMAKRISWEAKRRYFSPVVYIMDEYQIGKLVKEKLVLFICSTAGQGVEPKTMIKFWAFLQRKHLPADALSNVHCAVIGLGDSSYARYNFVGKKLFKRLKQLGAKLIVDQCLGDDQHDLGPDGAVDPWLEGFWSKLLTIYPLPEGLQIMGVETLPESTYLVLPEDTDYRKPEVPVNPYALKTYDLASPFKSAVLSNQRITVESHFQDVRLIKFQISDEFCMKHSPGDIVNILPENLAEDVADFLGLIDVDPEKTYIIKKEQEYLMYDSLYDCIPTPCTMRELVTNFLSLHDVPKRYFFDLFWKFSHDETERKKLREFSTTAGQQEVYQYCIKPRRTILEVMLDFPKTTKHIPVQYLFDLIPAIKPRSFSIASSLRTYPKQIHTVVAIVNYRTRLKKRRLGLCSNYLARLQVGSKVQLWVTKGTIKLPLDQNPIIMIGPGTGVAPFRSIIQERASKGLPANFLFFGCRYKTMDFIFEDEWNETHARGLLYFYVAFSRDNADKRVYVQDKLLDERHLIWELLSKCDAYIIIAGNARQMPQDVRQTIVKILELEGGSDLQGGRAEDIVQKFEARGKLQYDCWA